MTDERALQALPKLLKDPTQTAEPEAAVASAKERALERRTGRRLRARVGVPHLYITGFTDNRRAMTASELEAEILREGDQHPLLRTGLCGGAVDALKTSMQAVDDALNKLADEAAWSTLAPGSAGAIPSEFYPDEIGMWAKQSP